MTHRRTTSPTPQALGRRIPPIARRPMADPHPADSRPVADLHVNHAVLAAWWVLLVVGTLLQPAADGAQPEVLGALDTIVLLATLTVMFAVTASLLHAGGTRGGWMAFGGGLVFLGLSLACPATDHHALAGWWYGQLAASAGMALSGLVAVRHARRRR